MYSPIGRSNSPERLSFDSIALLVPGQSDHGDLPPPHTPPRRPRHQNNLGRLARPLGLLCAVGVVLFIGSYVISSLFSIPAASPLPSAPPPASGDEKQVDDAPCTSRECVVVASAMLNAMNATADPCHDFYEYTCGGWISGNPLPDDHPTLTRFTRLTQDNYRVLRRILESPYASDPALAPEDAPSNVENFRKIQDLYQSCLNVTQIEVLGALPLLRVLEPLTAHFPLAGKYSNSTDLERLMASAAVLHDIGVAALFESAVTQHDKHPQQNVISLAQGGLSLPSRDYYHDESFVSTLQQSVEGVLAKLAPLLRENSSDSHVRAQNVIAFELNLSNISQIESELSDPVATYNPFTIATLTQAFPPLPWDHYFSLRFPDPPFGENTAGPAAEIIVSTPKYLAELGALVARTPSQALQDYLLWRIVATFGNQLPVEFKRLLDPLEVKAGKQAASEKPRWQTCIAVVDSGLGDLLGRWFVVNAFAGDSKKIASTIVDFIKKAFSNRLATIPWLDDSTRKHAAEKIKTLATKIGYQDKIMQPRSLADKYQAVGIDRSIYLANYVNMVKFEIRKNLLDILIPVDRERWMMTPPMVNAYYSPALNEIVFPAGILQPPFFSDSFPSYVAYGAMGMVAGHELSHAFDSQGRHFDASGMLQDWWSNATTTEFEARAQCFKNTYEKWGEVGPDGVFHHIDGTLTMGENLADNSGLARAREAWIEARSQPGARPDVMLPGFGNMTRQQLLYVASAQIWCASASPEAAIRRILTNAHSPSRYRVWGMISNSPTFGEDFGCPVGTPMNPSEKCSLW
ncbi:Endothelin-converting enzyme 1 [Geranomyces variabilis]|uniref:Endothelin-converting enzyme 1 n=1 Tax=Geranomyces variabilis TaxID=109894 RepID=A0AAD5XP74_9FUNG|nr:Endothelin-converting enzyme 1 [Geranomyces variabilis]